ncbi:rhamnogalacturonan acetylesterase [Portibacter lacus]|uniref:Rhamnogalacturonan acetylesterase RhgT n=1 Tax=Portibacter lacus TaxID=1099794 RepID=A0AA37WDT4_9BACT|nr:rhamnogalacturonan acetylesterase [Portibacter lacus]GLR15465.1 rhamnogalacturonan acetylesterase RhgT [Portibacter lacus]
MKTILVLLCATCIAFGQKKQVKIYTIGDSTMADKVDPDKNPEKGWAQLLPIFFNDNVVIDNHAVNGKSSKNFRDLKLWEKVYDQLQEGDYVIIQFGHNDMKDKDPARFTNPHSTYRHNFINYVRETREKGAIPIICSSIVRRKFNEHGTLIDTHGDYPLAARLVAEEFDVPFIDLQYYSELLEVKYGVEGSKNLHLHFAPNENEYFPKGLEDNTHLSVLGATEISRIFVNELKKINHPLSAYLKDL